MTAAHRVRRILERAGISVERTRRLTPATRVAFMMQEGVTVAVDAGAHVGDYAIELRRNGYRGRIESLEPNPASFAQLSARSARDPGWTAHRVGLGDAPGSLTLNVAGNAVSSSFLPMREAHVEAAPESRVVGTTEAEVARLDDLGLVGPADIALLKIDTQGFERRVLDGATKTLESTRLVEMEMSLVPLYEGQMLIGEALDLMARRGFGLIWLDRGFTDRRRRLLQVDGIFAR